jgi:hypothetical protein
MRKLYLAPVQAAVGKPQSEFLDLLSRVLDLLQDNESVHDEGLVLVLDRFARLRAPPLAIPLRDAAVNRWGNPWLKIYAPRWGRVSPEARAMVSEWTKLEFIKAFFTLLAGEHTSDSRRLEFWARYVSAIDDIHFALGADARQNSSTDFKTLRSKIADISVPLQDNVKSNNAFIMRIGPVVIVEFSGFSNACYGYTFNDSLPFRFDKPLVLPKDSKNSLKHSSRELWLSHKDGINGYKTWEERFEAELAGRFGVKLQKSTIKQVMMNLPLAPPLQPPTPQAIQKASGASVAPRPVARTQNAPHVTTTPHRSDTEVSSDISSFKATKYSRKLLERFAEQFGLQIEDMSMDGGNLWIRTDDSNIDINEVLLNWRFVFKNASKGWWWRSR